MSLKTQLATDVVKITPPVVGSVAASKFLGHSWSDIAYFLTAIYTGIMITQNAWSHWIRPALARRRILPPKLPRRRKSPDEGEA